MRTITVLTPLRAEVAPRTAQRLAGVGRGTSPFAASERTHFARLLVLPSRPRPHPRPQGMRLSARILDLVTHLARPQRQDDLGSGYLAFSAAYDEGPGESPDGVPRARRDGDHSSYVEHLRLRLGPASDEIWGDCEGYPGSADGAAFADYLAAHTVPAAYVFASADSAPVPEVLEALRLRRRVIDLAVATQDADDAELRARFDSTFGTTGEDGVGRRDTSAPAHSTPSHSTPSHSTPAGRVAGDRGDDPDGAADEATEWNGWAEEDARRYPRLPRVTPHRDPPDLDDVQGLTVGYLAHDAAALVCLRITDAGAARSWLASTPVTTATDALALGRAVTARSLTGADLTNELPVTLARHVAVSHAGLRRLGVPDDELAGFDRAFRAGMARREHALAPQRGTATWQPAYRADDTTGEPAIDVLVQLSAVDSPTLATALAELRGELSTGGLTEVACEEGHRIPDLASPADGRRRYLEHFGFADGLSQPVVDGLGPAVTTRSPDGVLPTGELLLGYRDVDGDTAGATAPARLGLNGCYLVFRKLEQDVAAFRALVADGPVDAAKAVGRRRDGVPLTETVAPDAPFGFAHDPDGLRCPIGAHVRRVNPRDSRPLRPSPTAAEGARPESGRRESARQERDPVEPRLARRHRMLRRGIPYGERFPVGGDRGLLFVALVGDVGRQFEFVQTQWMNGGQAFRLGPDPDVVSGVAGPGLKLTVQGHPPRFVEFPRPLVTCRGGEYFLLPGVRALRTLAASPTTSPAHP